MTDISHAYGYAGKPNSKGKTNWAILAISTSTRPKLGHFGILTTIWSFKGKTN